MILALYDICHHVQFPLLQFPRYNKCIQHQCRARSTIFSTLLAHLYLLFLYLSYSLSYLSFFLISFFSTISSVKWCNHCLSEQKIGHFYSIYLKTIRSKSLCFRTFISGETTFIWNNERVNTLYHCFHSTSTIYMKYI